MSEAPPESGSLEVSIGAFLEQQREVGVSQSEGGFTVSHTNAARKLAKFALPRTYAWVSKIVQGAVAWNCDRLTISQSKWTTTFFLELPDLKELPTEKDLVSVMLSGRVGGTGPLQMFTVGLRAMVEQASLSFLLVLSDGEVKPQPVYAGHHFGQQSEAQRLSKKYCEGPGITLTVAHTPHSSSDRNSGVLNSFRKKIIEELETHCYFSPVPIEVNGERRNGLLRSTRFRSGERFRPLEIRGASFEGVQKLPLPPGFETKTMSALTDRRRGHRDYGGEKGPFQAVLLVGLQLPRLLSDARGPTRRYSFVHWVRAGVVVDSKQLPWGTRTLSCHFFLSAEGFPTDLTGFQLAESKELAESETLSVRALAEFLQGEHLSQGLFREDSDALSGEDRREDQRRAAGRRIKSLLKGGGAGVLLTPFAPNLGVPLALGSIAFTYLRKEGRLQRRLLELSTHFETMAKEDQRVLFELAGNWTVLPPLET